MAKETKEVLFAYPLRGNKNYVKKISDKTGQPLGYIIDKMVESFRLGKEFIVEPKLTNKEKAALTVKKKQGFSAKHGRKKTASK